MEVLKSIGAAIVNYYNIYSDFIHSIFKDQLGDLVEYVLDIAIAVIIVKAIAGIAFKTPGDNG